MVLELRLAQEADRWPQLVLADAAEGFMALTCSFSSFQIIPNFYPPLEAHVRQGVFNSLTHIVEKRVLA